MTSTVEKKELVLAPSDSANLQEGGKPVSIPTTQDGIYEVTLSGRDPEGREFRDCREVLGVWQRRFSVGIS